MTPSVMGRLATMASKVIETLAWLAAAALAVAFVVALITPTLRPVVPWFVFLAVGVALGRLWRDRFVRSQKERIRYLARENAALKRANYLAADAVDELRQSGSLT